MKRMNSLMIGCLFLIVACQPKDVEWENLIAAGNNNVSTNSTTSASGNDFNKLISLSVDRQVEAAFLLKAVLNPDFAKLNKLEIILNDVDQTTFLVNNVTAKSNYKVNYEVVKKEVNADGVIQEIILKNNTMVTIQSQGILDGKAADLTAKPMIEFIQFKKTANENEYYINIDRVDEINSKADGQGLVDMSIQVLMIWDGKVESLNQDIKLVTQSLLIDRKGNRKASMKFDPQIKSNISVQLGECVSVNGELELKQSLSKGKVITTTIKISESSMVVSANGTVYNYSAPACSSRMVVDLTKLL